MTTVLALVGSLRAGSHNRQIAETATELMPDGSALVIFDGLGEVPLYNEDIDTPEQVPAPVTGLREAIGEADALLLVSPENNGTIPAVLKNAIDWASRPMGDCALTDKPVAVIGTAYGQYGGVWAHEEARKATGIAGATVLENVEMSIGGSVPRFAEVHPKDDADVVERLRGVLAKVVAETAESAAA